MTGMVYQIVWDFMKPILPNKQETLQTDVETISQHAQNLS